MAIVIRVPPDIAPKAEALTPTEVFGVVDGDVLDKAVQRVNTALNQLAQDGSVYNRLRMPCSALGVSPPWRKAVMAAFREHWYVRYVASESEGEFYEFTAREPASPQLRKCKIKSSSRKYT